MRLKQTSLWLFGCMGLCWSVGSIAIGSTSLAGTEVAQSAPIRIPLTLLPTPAWRHGQILVNNKSTLTPIPAQWVPLAANGSVYSKAFAEDALATDYRLELMFADLFEQSCFNLLPSTRAGIEFAVQPTDGGTQRYVCLSLVDKPAATANFNDKQTSKQSAIDKTLQDYVKFDPTTKQVSSAYYRLALKRDNVFVWHDFFYGQPSESTVDVEGFHLQDAGESLLDSLKVNISAGFLTPLTRVALTSDDFETEILEFRPGLIHDSVFVLTKLQLAGATVLKMHVALHFYQQHVEMVTRFKIPWIAKTMVYSPKVAVSLDGNRLLGSKILTSWGPEQPLEVDGQLDARERAFTKRSIQGVGDSWVWLSTPRQFDLFAYLNFDTAFDVPMGLIYEDSLTQWRQPERFRGQLPNVGYSIDGVVMGRYFAFETILRFTPTIARQQVQAVARILQAPFEIDLVRSRPRASSVEDL